MEEPEEEQIDNKNQGIDYYEVAIGTDRRFPKTRDNVVPFTNVGRNLTHTFFDLDLVPLTALYYVTVRAHSFSQAVTDVTSNGFLAGYNDDVVGEYLERTFSDSKSGVVAMSNRSPAVGTKEKSVPSNTLPGLLKTELQFLDVSSNFCIDMS